MSKASLQKNIDKANAEIDRFKDLIVTRKELMAKERERLKLRIEKIKGQIKSVSDINRKKSFRSEIDRARQTLVNDLDKHRQIIESAKKSISAQREKIKSIQNQIKKLPK